MMHDSLNFDSFDCTCRLTSLQSAKIVQLLKMNLRHIAEHVVHGVGRLSDAAVDLLIAEEADPQKYTVKF